MTSFWRDDYELDGCKLQYHPEWVAAWRAGTVSNPPIYVEASPSGRCNQRCVFCSVQHLRNSPKGAGVRLRQLLANLGDAGVKACMLGGEGEPLLAGDEVCAPRGLVLALTTNGTMMDREWMDAHASKFTWIKVSVNAGTMSTYGKVHRCSPTMWMDVWDNISYLCSKSPRPTVGVQMVVIPENRDEAFHLTKRAAKSGCDYVVFKPCVVVPEQGEGAHGLKRADAFTPTEQNILYSVGRPDFRVIIRKAAFNGVHGAETQGRPCHSIPFVYAYIASSGDVYACGAHLGDERFVIGNVNTDDFASIWNSPRRLAAIEFMKTFDTSACRRQCRMAQCNHYLNRIRNPHPHDAFI